MLLQDQPKERQRQRRCNRYRTPLVVASPDTAGDRDGQHIRFWTDRFKKGICCTRRRWQDSSLELGYWDSKI